MTIVVSDTSPIRALAHLQLLTVLQTLFGEVIIPRAVAQELVQAPAGQLAIALDDLTEFSYLKIEPAPESAELKRFLLELDPGEAEALTLALALRADLILIDERAGRLAAKREGLAVLGVLGILLEAKRRLIVPAISPLIDQLQVHHQFFISDSLRDQILRAAGEVDETGPIS